MIYYLIKNLIKLFSDPFPPTLMVGDGAFCHKIDYVGTFYAVLNLKGHFNCISGSRVLAILLKGFILPIGEVASGRVCTCSLRSSLVYL